MDWVHINIINNTLFDPTYGICGEPLVDSSIVERPDVNETCPLCLFLWNTWFPSVARN